MRRCVGEREGCAEARGRPRVERPSVQILVVVASLFKRKSYLLALKAEVEKGSMPTCIEHG